MTNTNIIIRPSWLSGFIDGDGCFYISILKNKTIALGYQVQLCLVVTQHIRDKALLEAIGMYFGSGIVSHQINTNVVHYRLRDFNTIGDKLLPLLGAYPLITTKKHDLANFKRVYEMMKRREHLTQQGLDQIRAIKNGMNRGRKS